MALPIPSNSRIFSDDQKINFRAYYWDTSTTAVKLGPAWPEAERYHAYSAGVGFVFCDLLVPDFSPNTKADLDAAFQEGGANSQGKTIARSVLGYEDGEPRSGVVPSIYQYWGAGTLPGGGRAKQSFMKFYGYVKDDCTGTLVFGGQGQLRVYLNGIQILAGEVKEPDPLLNVNDFQVSDITDKWGYLYTPAPLTFVKGDLLEVYYWHNGERWGGIFGKILPGAIRADMPALSDSIPFLEDLRDAVIIGSSFMGIEPGGATLEPVPIKYMEEAALKVEVGSVSELDITLGLTTKDQGEGWFLDTFEHRYDLVDCADRGNVLRKGRLVHLEAGYVQPDGTDELYARFTGYIDDISVEEGGATAILHCREFSGRLGDVFDENYPDYVSYHANGYIMREFAAEPVFAIPAFDNWPIELALQELLLRSGVDPMNLGQSPLSRDSWANKVNHGRRRFLDESTDGEYFGDRLFAARSLVKPTERTRLERQSNYGNVPPLAKDYVPVDDAYLFRPEVTRRVYDEVKEIADHYGFDFFFDAYGQAVLNARNNPVYFQYMTLSGQYMALDEDNLDQKVHPSAVGGRYFYKKHSQGGWARVIEGHFSRLDLYVGIGLDPVSGLNGGKFYVLIEVWNGTDWVDVDGRLVDTWYDLEKQGFYYDSYAREDGTNAAVFRLMSFPFDHYRVTITPGGPSEGAFDCVYRFNGVAVYERDVEQSYMNHAFSTLENVIKVRSESSQKDLRNQVIVVGARRAAVTDSQKFEAEQNPNNPGMEFNVAVAADPFSIYDPTAYNFIGGKRMTVVFDEKVSDTDFARWLARAILFRYRKPKNAASLEHTAVPALEVRDAIIVTEERHHSIDDLLYVVSFTETWTIEEATTSIMAQPYPEIPSYQPREDLDIDALFDDDGDGKGEPVINVRISYGNIYGEAVTNVDLDDPTAVKAFATKTEGNWAPNAIEACLANSQTLNACAIPESIFLAWNAVGTPPVDTYYGKTVEHRRVLVNTPYRHFWNITGWTSGRPTLEYDFQEGDGSSVYTKSYYLFPTGAFDTWHVCYDTLISRPGSLNPFYDPYTSEVGNIVSVMFDALVSGRYRISVWSRSEGEKAIDTLVAYLTNVANPGDQPDAHWTYIEAGADVEYFWDGVDNVGEWNVLQSLDYARELEGAFGSKTLNVGAGFYAWNDVNTSQQTRIGDTHSRNFASDGSPHYTIGKYGQFYVKIEVRNDRLMLHDRSRVPRSVDTTYLHQPVTDPSSQGWNPTGEAYVFSHLGEPSHVDVRMSDWAGSAGTWHQGDITDEGDWKPTPDSEATIRVGSPVRFSFTPRARRGYLFAEDPLNTSAKLTRQAHLKTTVFDQFWSFYGQPWTGISSDNQGGVEQKRVTSRMYHSDDHTLEWEDDVWKDGQVLSFTEWVFDPSLFKKDFGEGLEEALRYCDYEQLEKLPGQSTKGAGGVGRGERTHFLLAFMNYLFYFSAFSIDRSGRRQWCINPEFVDEGKIGTADWLNTSNPKRATYYHLDHERAGSDRYMVRSIFARQWKEPGWANGSYPGNPKTKYAINDPLGHQQKFIQTSILNFELRDGGLANTNAAAPLSCTDTWIEAYRTNKTDVNTHMQESRIPAADGATLYGTFASTKLRPASFGTWTFYRVNGVDWFWPSPSRDFHPYWRYPFMPVLNSWKQFNPVADVLTSTCSQYIDPVMDLAAHEIWQGLAYGENYAMNHDTGLYGARLEMNVQTWAKDTKRDDLNQVFDYVRQDELARWEQFRGIYSRGPIASRNVDMPSAWGSFTKLSDYDWYNDAHLTASPQQPVKPSGIYYMSLARYNAIAVSSTHEDVPAVTQHLLPILGGSIASNWYDIRFKHEYAWYSPAFFPCDVDGFALPMFTRNEYTGVRDWAGGKLWWEREYGVQDILHDPGAWVGWRDDVDRSAWSANRNLRWAEIRGDRSIFAPAISNDRNKNGAGTPWKSGGWEQAIAGCPNAPADTSPYEAWWEGKKKVFKRWNIFDEYMGQGDMRLAVGPRARESVNIVMNLVLSDRLR